MTAITNFNIERRRRGKHNGIFVTFEGGEGSGKSTQIKRLAARLVELGHHPLVTREPGGSPGAEAVRHVLLSSAAEKFGAEMEAVLFSAARSDHVETVIKPALARNEIVLCDRFFDSTRVYQGVTGEVDMSFLKQLEEIACEDAWPDLTIILDLAPQTGMQRAKTRRGKNEKPDRFEKETIELQEKRRTGYLEIARLEPGRCIVVDAAGTTTQVFTRLWKAVEERLGEKLSALREIGKPVRKRIPARKAAAKKPATSRKTSTAKPIRKRAKT